MKPTRPKARPSDRPSMPGDEGKETRTVTSKLAPKTSSRPKARPDDLMEKREGATVERANRMKEREDREMNFAEGGMVRGTKPGQMSGKKFSGTF